MIRTSSRIVPTSLQSRLLIFLASPPLPSTSCLCDHDVLSSTLWHCNYAVLPERIGQASEKVARIIVFNSSLACNDRACALMLHASFVSADMATLGLP